MLTLTARSYTGETDLQPIVDLLNACEAVDREDNYYSTTGLHLQFTAPNFDPTQDIRLWHDANGQLIAFGRLGIPVECPENVIDGYLWFRVHPMARQRPLDHEIIMWAERRLRDVAHRRGLPAKLGGSCRSDQVDRIARYEQHGLVYERCFFRMVRSLSDPLPMPKFPDGFKLKNGHDLDMTAWVEMHNQTFIDHWNFHPLTVEQFNHWLSDPNYCPELDLTVTAPDGTYAAFCYAHIDAEANQQRRCREGWIDMLGTRRGFRRLGLGRAMLLSGLHRLQAAGMDVALLGVDSENPNQAYTLYESVGFRQRYANLCYSKRI